jgi:beta-lactamase class A
VVLVALAGLQWPWLGAAQKKAETEDIRAIAERFAGELGVFAKHLGSGQTIAWNPDVRFPTASVIKVAIMVEAFDQIARGALAPDARRRSGARESCASFTRAPGCPSAI